MIKGSVYIYIFYMYTHDKDIITESLGAPIFIHLPNEKNREYTCRKEKVRVGEEKELEGVGAVGQMVEVLVAKKVSSFQA